MLLFVLLELATFYGIRFDGKFDVEIWIENKQPTVSFDAVLFRKYSE